MGQLVGFEVLEGFELVALVAEDSTTGTDEGLVIGTDDVEDFVVGEADLLGGWAVR